MTLIKTWVASDQLLAADLNANFTETNARKIETLLAGEAITAGDALAAGYYQSDGGILFDAKGESHGSVAAGSTINITFSVANNSNRALIAFVHLSGASSTGTCTATYNSAALTQQDTTTQGSNLRSTSFVKFTPSTGSNTLSVVLSGGSGTHTYSIQYYSYYQVSTSAVDGHGINTNAGGTASVGQATTANGALVISSAGSQSTGSTITTANFTNNTQTNATNLDSKGGDSGLVFPAQTVTVTANSGGNIILACVSLAPITTPASGYVIRANASAAGVQQNRYNPFIGFALASASAAGAVQIQVGGIFTTSGLTPNVFYYLANSAGAIQTTVGTNTRKVGISLNTTQLLITNIW